MADMNSGNFTGRLGRDPELRQTNGGTPVCNFPMAVNGFKDDDALWLNVSVFGKSGEACAQYLGKGSKVAVVGRVSRRDYERQDGSPGTSIDLNARDVAFLDTKAESNGGGQAQAPAQTAAPVGGGQDDDIPF